MPRILDGKYLVSKIAKTIVAGQVFKDVLDELNLELIADGATFQVSYPATVRIAAKLAYPEARHTTPAVNIMTPDLRTDARAANKNGFKRLTLELSYTTAHRPSTEEDLVQYHNAYGSALSDAIISDFVRCSEGRIQDAKLLSSRSGIYTYKGKEAEALIGFLNFEIQILGRA